MTTLGPGRLLRLLADAEAVTWALLLVGMTLKYVTRTTDLGVTIAGGVHGFVFLAYVVGAVVVGVDQGWPWRRTAVAVLAAVPPFATIPFERWVRRRELAGATWRLRAPGAAGSVPERVLAAVLRRPVVATLGAIAVLAVVFRVLLLVGPPGA